MKDKITFQEFLEIEKKLEIRIGKILECEPIPKSKKLLKLKVYFEVGVEPKTVVTNLGNSFEPEFFVGLNIPFITNLEPTTIMGITSEAMIMVGKRVGGDLELDLYTNGTTLL